MFDVAWAQLRLALALAAGRPLNLPALDVVTDAMVATLTEFGALGAGATSVTGPTLDPDVAAQVAVKRFRTQASRAAEGTRHYAELFDRLSMDPDRLDLARIAELPITTKQSLRADPGSFVHGGPTAVTRVASTATTGSPTYVHYSGYELHVIEALTAQHLLLRGLLRPGDVLALCISSRATLAVNSIVGSCRRIGAVAQLVGLVEPREALAALAVRPTRAGAYGTQTPAFRPPTVLNVYPSYLGELVEAGLTDGWGPQDFALERVLVGGEIVTDSLLRRARRVFGDVEFAENCALTEIAPAGGTPCEDGHLHFEPTTGMAEVIALDGHGPAADGEPGTLVVTPFPPYRETTLLLRYDTGDVVRPLTGPLTCGLRHLRAVSRIEGKRALSVQHDQGWTFPRQVQEGLEAVDAVPLPARYSFEARPGGVHVTAVSRADDPRTRAAVHDSLVAEGVPVGEVSLVTDARDLRCPAPVRSDLRELSYETAA